MSIIKQALQAKQAQRGFLCAIGGARLAGKSTLAGTLPGKTLIIQPSGIEAGNLSPVKLAEKLGNHVDLIEFSNPTEVFEILADEAVLTYDNIYLDGISAYTELVYSSPIFQAKTAKNKWDGFDYIKDMSTKFVVAAKELAEQHDKNVFITYALKHKYDANGNPSAIEMVAKGNATKDLIEGKCGNVIVAYAAQAEGSNEVTRKLITTNHGPYVARLGNVLDEDNPKIIEPSLATLLSTANRI